jgi:hypothetical protein
LNFGLANGLQVRDTSETGYLYRKLEKSTESISLRYDDTVRNCNNEIIQMIYGEDKFFATNVVKSDLPITKQHYEQILSKDNFVQCYAKYSSHHMELSTWYTLTQQIIHPPEPKTTTEWMTAVDVRGIVFRTLQSCTTPTTSVLLQQQQLSSMAETVIFQTISDFIENR